LSAKEDSSDNRSQDELVQIAMGNVPLTPIVGQPNPLLTMNGASIAHPQVMNFPDLIRPHSIHPSQILMDGKAPIVVELAGNKPYHGGKNTVLELRKIPKELNNMMKLSGHFQRFGMITKLQVNTRIFFVRKSNT